jgi:UDP-N-acetylmuramate dehydrogenase
MISISEIKKVFRGKISLNERLSPFTTFRIGGVADYYVEPVDACDAVNITNYAINKEIPYYVMGNGSNVLISDDGIKGIVINLESGFSYLKHENGKIIAGAGAKMAKFVDYCIQNAYAGVEMLAGIPATVGGALVMNAGAYGGEMSDHVTEVQAIKNGEIVRLPKDKCGFMYRNSKLRQAVVLEGVFELPKGEPTEVSKRRKELLLKRNEVQPVEIPNAGCIFKNPKDNYAAKLIDECGLKGRKSGGAMVSPKHANFIVNYDNANAEDVIELIKIVKKTVKEKTGIDLELEVKLIGFTEVPV